MGYVFDALNRNDDDEPRGKTPESSDAPTPASSNEPAGESLTASNDAADAQAYTGPVEPENIGRADSPVEPPSETQSPQDPALHFFKAQADPTPTHTTTISQPPIPTQSELAQPDPTPTQPPLRLATEWTKNIDDRLVSITEPSSQLAEEYRGIRTTLLARWDHRRNLVHTITSATPQEGKTITSLNLGMSLAELRNRKTIVIEADLRLPTFNKLLHLGESKGMIGYLRGEAELDEVIQEIEGSALHIITAGSRASNDAVQLLSNNRMAKLLDELRSRYDHVIIDTPPVIELADAGILGGLSDEVMLIVRISRTPKPLIEQALRALRSYNAPVAGVIATDQERSRNRYHYYRYGYRYRYRYYAKRAA